MWPSADMSLRRVAGCPVYGGSGALAGEVAKLPKEKVIVFTVDSEESDVKDCPTFPAPFGAERPVPFSSFDSICSALREEDDKTQCVFQAKDDMAATTGALDM